MYSETRKPGIKQFFFGLLFMLCAYTAGILLKGIIPGNPLLRIVITIVLYCAAVYLIYIRYTAEYTYILDKKELTVRARAGRRADEASVSYKKIDGITYGRRFHAPLSHKTFTGSLFRNRRCCCVLYNNRKSALILEVSEEFYNKLKEHVK
ncbi:MAG: hypothetical protein PUE13_08065 [Clostridiales bacterium]|nr:hypothetical protein [Clostridiales bacterium]